MRLNLLGPYARRSWPVVLLTLAARQHDVRTISGQFVHSSEVEICRVHSSEVEICKVHSRNI